MMKLYTALGYLKELEFVRDDSDIRLVIYDEEASSDRKVFEGLIKVKGAIVLFGELDILRNDIDTTRVVQRIPTFEFRLIFEKGKNMKGCN